MILANISPYFARSLMRLQECQKMDSLWSSSIEQILHLFQSELSTDTAIGVLQKTRRISRIFRAGLQNDAAFKAACEAHDLNDWENFTEPPVHRSLQDALAAKLYIVNSPLDVPILEIGDQARYIGAKLFEMCVANKLVFDISVLDDNFSTLLLNHASHEGIARLSEFYLNDRQDITTRILVKHNLPVWQSVPADADKARLYRKLVQPFREKSMAGQLRSVLTLIPTTRDALVDGIPYPQYCQLYFQMCDQPWAQIEAAQGHLISLLDKSKTLRFTNNDGTDLSMNVEGFTFCNSVIARNIPGSEVFSAPHIDSTQGIIVAKGRFSVKEEDGIVIDDLTMRFERGHLVDWKAEKGQEAFDTALAIDAGAKRIGEIGIGTNPFLKQHLSSTLLVEKIGGSFHVALGDSYTMRDYMGTPVNVDNGNRSMLHWDITTMLIGKQGRIYADGQVIMDDGLFLDPALTVLNEGWKSIPVKDRPEFWQNFYSKGSAA